MYIIHICAIQRRIAAPSEGCGLLAKIAGF